MSLPEQLAHSPHTSTTAALSAPAENRRRIGRLVDGGKHLGAVDLRHGIAPLAGKHELALLMAGVTGKKGVAAFEAMHDAGGHQGIDGPVDRDRRQPLAPRRHPLQHLVGADGPVGGGGDLLEHRLAQRGEPQALGLEGFSRPYHGLVEAKRRDRARGPGRLRWGSEGHCYIIATAGLKCHRPSLRNPISEA